MVAISAVVRAAYIFAYDSLQKMEQTRHYYLNEATGYAGVEGFSRAGTGQRNGASLDQKEGSAEAGWIRGR